jgi:hypothetical protein
MGSVAGRLVGVLATAVTLVGCSAGSPDAVPTTTPTPRIVDAVQLGPRTVDLTISSPAVGPAVAVRALLPTRYAVDPTRTWPVLYLFHGCCDTTPMFAQALGV